MDGNAGGVDLDEAGVGEHGAFLVALPGGGAIASHGVGREEEDIAVAAGGHHYGVGSEALDFAGHQVTGDDAAGFPVDDHHVEHLMTAVHFDISLGDLPVEGLVGAQQELLAGLATGIERAAHQHPPEGAVVKQSAIFTGKGDPLGHALVDDVGRDLRQAVYVGFTGPVIPPLDGIIEKTVDRVVVVLVVLGGVDASLSGDGVGAARTVLVAKSLHIIAQFGQ